MSEDEDRCSVFGSCRTCVMGIGCRWCSSTQRCFDVLKSNFSCPEICVKSESRQCPRKSNCTSLKSCSSCIQNDCVWCRDTRQCYEPGLGDPEQTCFPSLSCNCPVTNITFCSQRKNNCSQFTDCNTCVSSRDCGWCTSLNKCVDVTPNGSTPCGNFTCKYLSYQNCSEQCRSNSNCSSCVKDSADCSWCAGGFENDALWSNTLYNNQPRLSFCVLGKSENDRYHCRRWHNFTCPNCEQYSGTSCMNCTASSQTTGKCGWCYSTKTCAEGDTHGPFDYYDCNNISNWSTTCHARNWTNITTPVSPPVPPPPTIVPHSPLPTPVFPPLQNLTPSYNPLSGNDHLIDIVVGSIAGTLVVIIGAVTWMKCSARSRNRYRAIG